MSTIQTSSSRRKGKKSHYVVVKGRDIFKPTIFTSWEDARMRIENFPCGECKGFYCEAEAEDYIRSLCRTATAGDAGQIETRVAEEKAFEASAKGFYAVFKGRQTGVFTSWAEAREQTNGFSGNCHKKFKTEEEAWRFVDTKCASKGEGNIPEVLRNTPSRNIPRGDGDKKDLSTIFIQLNLQSV